MNPADLALPPGTRVDSLRIDRLLDQGAFGATYLVTDTVLSAPFALKEYLPRELVVRAADGRVQARNSEGEKPFADGLRQFLAEGRTLANLGHPNVVRVNRCFEANGTAYLLMPYYRGEALHKLLSRGGTFSEDEALALGRPLLDALDYLHHNGVVHQDIKPANVYITESGDPVLLDFGAAGVQPSAAGSSPSRLGSEGYAAIEQSTPGAPVGPWTDIYGLAATLYRCVSGRVPAAASRRQNTLAAKQPDPLEALDSLVERRAFATVIPAIEAGLELAPADRPQSISEWRAVFDRGSARFEPEGREWLPLLLLSTFLLLLAAAVIYLFTADRWVQPGAAPAEQTTRPVPPQTAQRPASPEEIRRWQAALGADSAYGYRLFLEDFPDSIHVDQANLHIERLDHEAWQAAQAVGDRAAIEAYLQQFPGGRHDSDARIRLEEIRLEETARARESELHEREELEAWKEARAQRTLAAIDAFLATWPAGLHADEARSLRAGIESEARDVAAFEAASKLNTIAAYRAYLEAFPAGHSVAAALQAIDDLTLRPGKTFSDCAGCPTLVVVPPGSFWQGSDGTGGRALKAEMPRHMVTIAAPFAIGVFEVTMAQWDACVADGGCSTRPGDNGWGRESRPVIMVSWNDAVEYTAWLSKETGESYGLPSESQWEYAARAGEESEWLGGDESGVCQFGNVAGAESGLRWQHAGCADPSALETLPVGSLRPNAFGLYDVIGNVAEWTLDCMNLSYLDAPVDGSAWGRGICSSRMTRGGSWFTGSREIRLPARFSLKNGDRNDFTGFRVVRRLPEQ